MPWFYLVSVWLHLLAAAAWIGSMLFFAAVVVPLLRDSAIAPRAPVILRALGTRYRVFGHVTLGILIVTGATNLLLRGIDWRQLTSGSFWLVGFGHTLAQKLVAVAAVILVTVVHEMRIGAHEMRRIIELPTSPEALALRRRASWLGRLTLLLSLVVLFFAVELVRGAP